MGYRATAVIEIEFPQAENLDQAQTTFDIWLDLIAPILADKVSWPEVNGTPIHYEEEGEQ